MRSASQPGTRPPCRGRSALPPRCAMRSLSDSILPERSNHPHNQSGRGDDMLRPVEARSAAMTDYLVSDVVKAANLPFSQAVRTGETVYLSGMLGTAPGKMELVPGGIEAEARQMMENVGGVLKDAGLSFDNLV